MSDDLTPKPGHRVVMPDDKPTCPTHGCFMTSKGKCKTGVVRRFYCPVDGCGEWVSRVVKKK